ncbi:MAG TPA: hypothetical protein VGN63_18275 [Flavisolibacter sp.]|jgi:hypothetical protein|nr:hypothetical protein [Flavisolibacter sp.]
MKKGILLLFLISSLFADAQSLKEALYGGKLKNQPGTVVRKGDDLAKLEAEKREAEQKVVDSLRADSVTKAMAALSADSIAKATAAVSVDSAAVAAVRTETPPVAANPVSQNSVTEAPSETAEAPKEGEEPAENAVDPKDNNALLKAYMNGIITTLKSEVLSSKKVKDGSYYVLVSYAIETDGQLNITDVFVSPENDFMQKQIKERLALDTPKLNPVLSSSGKARKVNKKYNFTLVKE